jgi:hypothetical protein
VALIFMCATRIGSPIGLITVRFPTRVRLRIASVAKKEVTSQVASSKSACKYVITSTAWILIYF